MIRGIGGLFLYADDAAALVAWYTRHFGIEFDFEPAEQSYYRDFVLPLDADFGRVEREVFAIRQSKTPLVDKTQRFVLNLRVRDLRSILEHLRLSGIEVERTEDFEYGRFAWLRDLEGNSLELFEPV